MTHTRLTSLNTENKKGDYDRERQNITFLCSWITKTVAANLFDTTCDPEQKIHEWYAALKERVGTNDLQELRRAMEEWETANKTLSRRPKDMLRWLKSWELALLKAQKAKVPGKNDSKIWWLEFDNTVRGFGYDGWCDSYYNSNQDAIDNNNLVLQKLLNDFSERIRRSDDSRPRTIAKGAFVTFAERTSDEEERDSEPRRSTQRSPASRRKRSRSPAPRTTNKRLNTEGSTSGCQPTIGSTASRTVGQPDPRSDLATFTRRSLLKAALKSAWTGIPCSANE